MLDFLAVGDVMLDVHVPAPHPHGRLHAPVRVCAGGSAVNAALAAAELGHAAGVVGAVGDDAAGRTIAEELARHGVESHLQVGGTTGTTVYVGAAVIADRGANAAFACASLPEARVTLLSGYLSPEQLAAVLPLAPGFVAVDLQGNHHDLPHVDAVLGPGIDIDAWDAGVVCSTLGADGAVASDGGDHVHAASPLVVAHQLRGAGDRFAAAFLLGLTAGSALRPCLEHACAFATRSRTSIG